MKCIIKAMAETEYKPRKKWWGFVKDELRYLCRYDHVFCIFSKTSVVYSNYETVTDRRGVEFAINHFNKNNNGNER